MRNYLSSESTLTLQEKKETFKIRTRMTELKTNYKNKYDEYNCLACEKNNKINEETQEHIFYCHEIKHNNGVFANIFENTYGTKTIKEITNKFTSNMKERKKFLPDEPKTKIATTVDQVVR